MGSGFSANADAGPIFHLNFAEVSIVKLLSILISSVVTVLLLPHRFGFGSVFNEKPRSRFLSVSVFSPERVQWPK